MARGQALSISWRKREEKEKKGGWLLQNKQGEFSCLGATHKKEYGLVNTKAGLGEILGPNIGFGSVESQLRGTAEGDFQNLIEHGTGKGGRGTRKHYSGWNAIVETDKSVHGNFSRKGFSRGRDGLSFTVKKNDLRWRKKNPAYSGASYSFSRECKDSGERNFFRKGRRDVWKKKQTFRK